MCLSDTDVTETTSSTPELLNLLCDAEKFCPHARKMELNAHNKE
jgi:hypothetical protein